MWSKYAYNVGGLLFTLDEIEHGVLRCNKGHPKDEKPMFEDDARKSLSLSFLDPRIHFALNCGATSCPPIRLLKIFRLDKIAIFKLCLNALFTTLDSRIDIAPGINVAPGTFGKNI